jgi:hypothetical protein
MSNYRGIENVPNYSSMPKESRQRGSKAGGDHVWQKKRLDKFIKFLPDEKAMRKVR